MNDYHDSTYFYIGKLNPWIRYQFLLGIILIGIIIFFFSFAINTVIPLLVIVISLVAIISVLKFLNLEDNMLMFCNDKLMYSKGRKLAIYPYDQILKIEFVKPSGNREYVKIKLNRKSFIADIEQVDGKDLQVLDFIDFVFSKNEKIEIFEIMNFEKFKYFKLNGAIRKVTYKAPAANTGYARLLLFR